MEFPGEEIFGFIWLFSGSVDIWGLPWDREQDGESQGLEETKAALRWGRAARDGVWSPSTVRLRQRQKWKRG